MKYNIEQKVQKFLELYHSEDLLILPNVILSAIPMELSMQAWESGNYDEIQQILIEGVNQVAKGGADFFVCPDYTAHIVLENIVFKSPISGHHITDIVCHEINSNG